jgi:hypothetical protein
MRVSFFEIGNRKINRCKICIDLAAICATCVTFHEKLIDALLHKQKASASRPGLFSCRQSARLARPAGKQKVCNVPKGRPPIPADGRHDDLPVEAFYFTGSIEDIRRAPGAV